MAWAQAPAAEVTELGQVVEALPRQVLLDLQGSKKDAAEIQATDVLRDKVQGRQATFKVKMERMEKDEPGPEKKDKYRLKAEDVRFNKGSSHFLAHLWVHFDAAESEKVAALKKGAQVTATGKIAAASVSSGTPLKLHVAVGEAKLK